PEDWDDEEDGEWIAPTMINPEFTFFHLFIHSFRIVFAEFKDDPEIYVFPNLNYVGIELWQVKSGTLFDNVLICDDPEYAKKFAEETWAKNKDAEKAAFDEAEKKAEEPDDDDEESVEDDAEDDSELKGDEADDDEEVKHDEL
ncbi:unnamed protein product, partial [Linum perenne]